MKVRLFTFTFGEKPGRDAKLWTRRLPFITLGLYATKAKAQANLRAHQRQRWRAKARVLPITVEIER